MYIWLRNDYVTWLELYTPACRGRRTFPRASCNRAALTLD